MRLETERLLLRLPRLEDARAFDEFWQDEEASRFVGGVSARSGRNRRGLFSSQPTAGQ